MLIDEISRIHRVCMADNVAIRLQKIEMKNDILSEFLVTELLVNDVEYVDSHSNLHLVAVWIAP